MNRLRSIWRFYYEGFRDMSSLGRTLWILIIIKLIIIFVVLRIFFFRPAMAGCADDEEKSRTVMENLVGKH